jgi:hypothetical protein
VLWDTTGAKGVSWTHTQAGIVIRVLDKGAECVHVGARLCVCVSVCMCVPVYGLLLVLRRLLSHVTAPRRHLRNVGGPLVWVLA